MQKPILQLGDLLLKTKCRPAEFDNNLEPIISDLIETMRTNGLVGLAAAQMGYDICVFVTEIRNTPDRAVPIQDDIRIFINPTISYKSADKVVLYEGCGSVAEGKIFAPVERPKVIKIEAQNQNGTHFSLKCDGLLARTIQHEYDHCQGIQFIEKVADNRTIVSREFYKENIKNSEELIKNSVINIKEYVEI